MVVIVQLLYGVLVAGAATDHGDLADRPEAWPAEIIAIIIVSDWNHNAQSSFRQGQ